MTYLQRKKLAFMSIVNNIKGFLRTVSGIPPLTLTDCVDEDSVINYTVNGNSVQFLPQEYSRLNYIESSGTQYIDTGVVATQNTGFDIEFISNNPIGSSGYGCIFGARRNSNTNEFQLTSFRSNNTADYQGTFRFGTISYDGGIVSGEKYTISLRNGVYTQNNGNEVTLEGSFTTPCPITLFALNNNGSPTQHGSLQLFGFKLYEGDELLRDFVPCYRAADNVVGLYDLVKKQFYKNGGTGSFSAGSSDTPSPENPVEIESVGERTKNLFSHLENAYNSFSTYSIECGVLTISPTSLKAYQSYVSIKLGELELGKTYTVSYNVEYNTRSGARPFTRVGYHSTASGTWKGDYKTRTSTSSGRYYITFTLPDTVPEDMNEYGFCILFNYTNVAATELYDYKIYDIMLVEGSVSADYEPYGYRIPIVCSGKNMFDVNRWYEELTEACTHSNKPYFTTIDGLDCIAVHPPANMYFMKGEFKENTQYTLSFYAKSSISNYTGIVLYYTDGTKFTLMVGSSWGNRVITSTAGKTISRMGVYYYGGAYAYYHNIQLEEGTTATDYEPYIEPVMANIYLDEPLRRVGSVADSIDFEKQLLTRKIGKWMFTDYNTSGYLDHYSARMSDTQEWTTCCVAIPFRNMAAGYTNKIVSHFKRGANGQAFAWKTATHGIYSGHPDYNNIYINLGDSKSLYNVNDNHITNWEHWNEAYVIGELATPTEEPITLPKLPTIKGITIMSVDTSIQPSYMELTYYATSKE